ncbi:hypothetical protein EPN96_09370 [bacterium]|nr:MAG: hypothetical protein EPN96_09370 [bacterium]
MRNRLVFGFTALLLLAFAVGCSDTKVPIGAPHPLGREWLITGGADFHGSSSLNCSDCHDPESFCFTCHFGPGGAKVPPDSGWSHGSFPHDLDLLKSVGDVCDRCHAITKRYTDQPDQCHLCHEAAPLPHPMGRTWLSSEGAQFHGNPEILDLPFCQECHEISTFCSECHFGPGGAKVPEGVDWPHGWMSHTQSALVDVAAVCVRCHELTRSFGQGPGNATCTGCHDGAFPMHESYAPADSSLHYAPAKENLKLCQLCHGRPGTSFESGVSVVACSTCHEAAKAHPTDWQGDGTFSHRTAGNMDTACVLCHDVTQGRTPPLESSPSCFSAEFTNADGQTRTCHPNGFIPHARIFAAPELHGGPAKENLSYCQICHGTPGTTSFSGGSADTACSTCHTAADAHPTDWQGAGTYSHRTAGNAGTACTICHDVTEGRTPPNPDAPSCFAVSFTNANGQTRDCHPGGPGVPHAMPFAAANLHGVPAKQDLTYCQLCHGQPGSTNFGGGTAEVACSACHTAARAHPTNWQGAGTYSHQTAGNLTAACGLCHRTTGAGTGPLSGAPSCFNSTFTNALGQTRPCHEGGPGIPHAPPAQFALPSAHGPVAKQDLAYCQKCHGQPGTRFFEGGSATACAACHTAAKAHPTNWQGAGTYSHRNADNMPTTCSLCHDYTQGRTPPMAGSPSCFAASFTNALGQTRSCHPGGPGATHPLGQPWMDSSNNPQFHGLSSLVCSNCHTFANKCSQCHFGTITNPTYSPAGSHVTFGSHDNYGSFASVCNACHNTNRTYGNPPSSCHNCH